MRVRHLSQTSLMLFLLAAAGMAYGDAASAPASAPSLAPASASASAPASAAVSIPSSAPAPVQNTPDYQLKAAFLYNFATFVDWPDSLGKSLEMCVATPPETMKYFSAFNGKPVGDKTITVRHLSADDSAEDCRILFSADSQSENLEDWLSEIQDENVLTVAESEPWLNKGVILVVQVVDGRVVFDINMDAARGEGVAVNSRVLRMARRIQGLEPAEEPGGQHAK